MNSSTLRCSAAQRQWRAHRRRQAITRAARLAHHALAAVGAAAIGMALAWLLR